MYRINVFILVTLHGHIFKRTNFYHYPSDMTFFFLLKTKIGKFAANIFSAFVRDKEKRHRLRERMDPLNPSRCISYLCKHYTAVKAIDPFPGTQVKNNVWVCWLQGAEQAPSLIRNCIQSIHRFKPKGYEVVVITEKNYSEYVTFPDKIEEKWQKGLISRTHFSDLLRIYLLASHGGLWMDATCLLTAVVPDYITERELFLFHTHGEFSYTMIQSCFMSGKKNNYALRKWCAAMAAYWEKENRLIHYFTLHLMFIALTHDDPLFANEFNSIPVRSDEPSHILIHALLNNDPYSEELMEQARKGSFFQKLTYKFPKEFLEDKKSIASVLSSGDYPL